MVVRAAMAAVIPDLPESLAPAKEYLIKAKQVSSPALPPHPPPIARTCR